MASKSHQPKTPRAQTHFGGNRSSGSTQGWSGADQGDRTHAEYPGAAGSSSEKVGGCPKGHVGGVGLGANKGQNPTIR